MEKKEVLLVDVSSMFFRAFYAIRELNTSKGFPTNALYGFLSMTVKLINKFKPEYMAFCLDPKGGSFRNELDENYKANRSEMPEDLVKQLPYIFKLTEVLGIPQFIRPGYEADDIIGSLARWSDEKGFKVTIISGDKDFSQLINENVSMFDSMKNRLFTPEEVFKKWGVRPDQFIDYLAIVGDSSDNVPGVRGIGPKGAEKLLKEFDTLDGVYQNLDSLKGATLKKLQESKDSAYLSQEIVKIILDLKIVESEGELKVKDYDYAQLKEILEELEFDSFLKNFDPEGQHASSEEGETKEEVAVKEITKSKALVESLDSSKELLFLPTDQGELLCQDGKFYSLKLDPSDYPKLGETLKEKGVQVSGYDLKSFYRKLQGPAFNMGEDLQLLAYSECSENLSLKDVIEKYSKNFKSLGSLKDYAEGFSEALNQLKEEGPQEALKIYNELEKPLSSVLLNMERRGILLDQNFLEKMSESLKSRIDEITQRVHEMVDKKFNLSSPKQLSKVLFEDLGLIPIKKTKTGFSTNTDVLEKLSSEHPICREIIEYRELTKLKSTYVDALPKLVNAKTQRVHTTFNQALTTTGRLSSVSPNLQNIPIKTEEGRKVRQAFVAKEGHVLLSADYSQIELRILAHIAQDKALIEAFKQDQDIHSRTAAEVFQVDLAEVTSDQRRSAKAVNFGIAYGQGAYGLSETLGISRKEAKEIIEHYFERFPAVKKYIEDTKEKANEQFFVETLMGRKREIKELKSSNKMLQKFGERAAINAPIQGTASDIIKLAMIKIQKELELDLLLQVHDELIFEVPEEQAEKVSQQVVQRMEEVFKLDVPLKVNASFGKNWDEAH